MDHGPVLRRGELPELLKLIGDILPAVAGADSGVEGRSHMPPVCHKISCFRNRRAIKDQAVFATPKTGRLGWVFETDSSETGGACRWRIHKIKRGCNRNRVNGGAAYSPSSTSGFKRSPKRTAS